MRGLPAVTGDTRTTQTRSGQTRTASQPFGATDRANNLMIHPPHWKLAQTAGFTLTELVMVMVIVAILAKMAMPRFAQQSAFNARGFYDETLALLHYAQTSAIAQHRTVCVTLNASGVTSTIATVFPYPTNTSCDGGAFGIPVKIPAGSGLSANHTTFQFTPSGGTDQTTDVIITIAGSNSITVDAVTGYAR